MEREFRILERRISLLDGESLSINPKKTAAFSTDIRKSRLIVLSRVFSETNRFF